MAPSVRSGSALVHTGERSAIASRKRVPARTVGRDGAVGAEAADPAALSGLFDAATD